MWTCGALGGCALLLQCSPTCFNPAPVFQESRSPPTPDSTLPPLVFFPPWTLSFSPDVPTSFPVRPKWEGHLPRRMGMPLGEGVGKVNRGGQEKLDDGRTSPLVWIVGSFSPSVQEEWGPMTSLPPTSQMRWSLKWPHCLSWPVNYPHGWPMRMRSLHCSGLTLLNWVWNWAGIHLLEPEWFHCAVILLPLGNIR